MFEEAKKKLEEYDQKNDELLRTNDELSEKCEQTKAE